MAIGGKAASTARGPEDLVRRASGQADPRRPRRSIGRTLLGAATEPASTVKRTQLSSAVLARSRAVTCLSTEANPAPIVLTAKCVAPIARHAAPGAAHLGAGTLDRVRNGSTPTEAD